MQERKERLVMFTFVDGSKRFVPENEAISFASNHAESDSDLPIIDRRVFLDVSGK